LPTSREADYAVGQEAAWKRDVWRTVFGLPRRATPWHYVTPSARPSLIQTTRAGARATAAPPAAAISWSSNASTAPATNGRWPVSSSATCASTTTCPSTTSARPATSPRQASYAICSTRLSTRFDPSNRRSRSAATQQPGWRYFGGFQVSISRARNTVDRTTGPSGGGIASGHVKTNRPPSSRRRGLPRRLVHLGRRTPTAHCHRLLVQAAQVRRMHRSEALAHQVDLVARALAEPAAEAPVQVVARPARPIPAEHTRRRPDPTRWWL